jgi:hypothetical protein
MSKKSVETELAVSDGVTGLAVVGEDGAPHDAMSAPAATATATARKEPTTLGEDISTPDDSKSDTHRSSGGWARGDPRTCQTQS